jgi:hypothetical protein
MVPDYNITACPDLVGCDIQNLGAPENIHVEE